MLKAFILKQSHNAVKIDVKMYKYFSFFFIVLLVSVCILPVEKTQGDSQWEELGLYGGQINALAVHPDNVCIISPIPSVMAPAYFGPTSSLAQNRS